MKRKINLFLPVILVITLVLTGCYIRMGEKQSSSTEKDNQNSIYNQYYEAKVKYVGDNSKDGNLLKVLGAGDLGDYTIALTTDKEPYGLAVNYSKLKDNAYESKFKDNEQIDYAFYLLALIDNLSFVDINYKAYNYHLDIETANKIVNGDIKTYGSSPEKLEELSHILSAEN